MPNSFLGSNLQGIIDYTGDIHQYPVGARDRDDDSTAGSGIEGAHFRFLPLPTPEDIRMIALFGLKRLAPDAYAEISDKLIQHHLTSAMGEMEMQHNLRLTPTETFVSVDYVSGMFAENYSGIPLRVWPATAITQFLFKFPHSQTSDPILQWEVPPNWVILRHNMLNVACDYGRFQITRSTSGNSGMPPLAGMMGFMSGNYRPSAIEVRYLAGFTADKVPATVCDWIVTLASIRLLTNVIPLLFPFSSSSVTIDGVTQSSSINAAALLTQRLQQLEVQAKKQQSAVLGSYGRNFHLTFVGQTG